MSLSKVGEMKDVSKNLLMDTINNNLSNPKQLFTKIIHIFLASKLEEDSFIAYIFKMLLVTRMDTLIDFIQQNFIKIFYLMALERYTKMTRRLQNYTEINLTIKPTDFNYNSVIDILLKMDQSVTVKYVIDENFEMKPTLEYLDLKKDYGDHSIYFTVTSEKHILVTAKSKTISPSDLFTKVSCIIDSKIIFDDDQKTKNVCRIDLDSDYNSTIKKKLIDVYVLPMLKLGFETTYAIHNYEDGDLFRSAKQHGLVTKEINTNLPKDKRVFLEKINDIEVYMFSSSQTKYVRLICISTEHTHHKIAEFMLNRLSNFIKPDQTMVDTKQEKQIYVHKYVPKSGDFVKTGCPLRKDIRIFLSNAMKKNIDNIFKRIKHSGHIFDQLGIPKKCGVLLYGPPGTGKTTTIKYLSQMLERSIYMINFSDFTSNSKLDEVFDQIKSAEGIIVVEDVDKHIQEAFTRKKKIVKINKKNRRHLYESDDDEYMLDARFESKEDLKVSTNKEIDTETEAEDINTSSFKKNRNAKEISVSEEQLTFDGIMNRLDGLQSSNDQIFILSSNNPEVIKKINPALIRSGRIDYCIKVDHCCKEQFGEIVKFVLGIELVKEDLLKFPENKYATVTIVYAMAYYSMQFTDTQISVDEILKIIEEYDSHTSSAI